MYKYVLSKRYIICMYSFSNRNAWNLYFVKRLTGIMSFLIKTQNIPGIG